MTLKRTIQRREKRKRAKLRPKPTPTKFITAEWVIRETVEDYKSSMRFIDLFNRNYWP